MKTTRGQGHSIGAAWPKTKPPHHPESQSVDNSLEDKVVVITGAGKGLGRAYALYLAGFGARVVVNNRRHAGEPLSSANQVVNEINRAGGTAVADFSSVEDPKAGQRLVELALDTFGRLDAVVANAGVSEATTFHKQNLDDFHRVVDINLMGTVNILHPAFCHMYEQRRGSLVVSSSGAGLYGEHGLPSYSTSKAAVLGLMYSLSKEGAPHGVRVNALAPFARTNMTESDLPPELRERCGPERVAPVLAWLISDDCALNGETVVSGGGRIALARVLESGSVALPEDAERNFVSIQATWEQLDDRLPDQLYRGALEQFGKFIGVG